MGFYQSIVNGRSIWVADSITDFNMEAANNLIQWGQPYPPKFDQHYNWDGSNPTVMLSQAEMMTKGYGNSIGASDFPLIQQWVSGALKAPSGGSYTFDDLQDLGLVTDGDRWISRKIYFGGLNTGTLGFVTGAYVHGTVEFALMSGTAFYAADGKQWVSAEIGAGNDDFNFDGSVPFIVNLAAFLAFGPDYVNAEAVNIVYDGSGGKIDIFGVDHGHCFAADSKISTPVGDASIQNIRVGDLVLSFRRSYATVGTLEHVAHRDLTPKRVVALFQGVTDVWVKLSNGLVVTPGHHFLDALGNFRTIADILNTDGHIVLADSSVAAVTGEYVHYSEATADLYEQAEGYVAATVGGLALQPVYKKGWKTYNFEVEDLHTYIAGGVRVHNESTYLANGTHTYPGTTSVNPVTGAVSVVNANGSVTITNPQTGAVNTYGVGTRQYNPDTNSWETVQPGPRQRETILGSGPLVTLASGMQINAGSITPNEATGGFSIVNANGSVTIVSQTGVAHTYGVGTTQYNPDTNSWAKVEAGPGPRVTIPGSGPPVTLASGTLTTVGTQTINPTTGAKGIVNSNGSVTITNPQTGSSNTYGVGTRQYNPDTNSWGTIGTGGQFIPDGPKSQPKELKPLFGPGGYFSSGGSAGSSDHDDDHDGGFDTAKTKTDSKSKSDKGEEKTKSKSKPVLLDLSGTGAIDPLFASSQFVDFDGDGYLNRTAWAGAGTGVLVLDTNNDDKINRSNEFVFTEWDSSASGDLEAIRNVFDTNHNGLLDGGDARWSEFKVLVDGTMRTLASLGIVSIDLTPKGSGLQYADRSSLNGTTVFTRTDGTTGMVGDATLVGETASYRIERTSTTASDGTISETILGYNRDGKLAFRNLIETRADGNWRMTWFDDDGNGTIDRSQRYDFVLEADGSRTRSISNIAAEDIYTSSTVTWTSADGRTIINTIDEDGDGNADQSTDLVVAADGSSISLTQAFSDDNTLTKAVKVETSANGLTKTTSTDANGDHVFESVVSESTIIHANGSRTRTDAKRDASGNLLGQTETVTSADNRNKTVKFDRSGTGVYDETAVTTIAIDGAGTISTTVSRSNADASLRGRTVTTVSANGLAQTEAQDLTGDGVADRVTAQTTVIAADNSRVQTETLKSANGTLLSNVVTSTSANGKSITTTEDGNGDGAIDRSRIISVAADGVTTETLSQFRPNGGLVARTISQTSADGRSITSQIDANGDGVIDLTQTAVTVTNGDGSQTRTVTNKAGNAAVIGSTATTTSADSLVRTIASDYNGDGVVDGTTTSTVALNMMDGSRSETVVSTAGNGTVLDRTTTTTSMDRQTTTRVVDDNGDGLVDLSEVQTRHADDTRTLTATRTNAAGALLSKTITTTSGDGLAKTVEQDVNGDGVIDAKGVSTTALNADGSRTVTTTASTGSSIVGKTIVTTSGNGLVVTTQTDADGNGTIDGTVTETTVLNSNGSRTTTAIKSLGGTAVSKTITTVNATGLIVSTSTDADSNNSAEQIARTTKQLNADGSTVETVEALSATGALLAKAVTTSSADRRAVTTTEDNNGDGVIDGSITSVLGADGVTARTVSQFKANGALVARTISQVSADGLTTTRQIDANGDGVTDRTETETTLLNADGSKTTTVTAKAANGALIASTTTLVTANGLSQTQTRDGNGDGIADGSSSSTLVRNADGSTTETVNLKAASGTLLSRTVTTKSGDSRVATRTVDDNGDGLVDLREVRTRHADASESLVATRTDAAGTVLGKTITTTSSTGLSTTVEHDINGDGVIDGKTVTATVLNADGSRTTTTTATNGTSVVGKTIATTSANEMSVVTDSDTDGDGDIDVKVTETAVLNANGSRTITTTRTEGTKLVGKTVTSVSANGLVTATAIDADGSGTAERVVTTTRQLNSDGSIVETAETRTAANILLARVVTTTSGNGKTVSITEDIDGDGTIDASITSVTGGDGAGTVTRRQLGAAGALLSQSVVETSADGLTQTTKRDGDGDATFETIISDVTTINADGSKTQTISETKADGTLVSRQVVTTGGNGLNRTTTWSGAAGAALGSETAATITNADGSTLQTVSRFKPDGVTLERKTTILTSGNGRSVISRVDLTGDGKIDQQIETTRQADGSLIETRTDFVGDGITARSRKTTTTSSNGLTETVQYDANADGVAESKTVRTTILNANGSKTETTETFGPSPSGLLLNRIVVDISANGLVQNRQFSDLSTTGPGGQPLPTETRLETTIRNADGSTTQTVRTGSGSTSQEVLSRTVDAGGLAVTTQRADIGQNQTDITVLNSDGSKTRTITSTSSTAGGSQISKTTTTTSADGRTITSLEERTGQANRTLQSTRVDRADGFVLETLNTRDAGGTLLDKTTTTTSPDQRLVVTTRDFNGDGQIDQSEERVIAVDGSTTVTINGYKAGGAVDNITISKTSADGLTTTSDRDRNGNGVVEHKRVSVTTQDAAGQRITVITDRDETSKLLSKSTVTLSADGKTQTTVKDVDGTGGTSDLVETVTADGSRFIRTVQTNNAEAQAVTNLAAGVVYWKKAIARRIETSTAVDGTETIISSDYAGDNALEHVVRAVTQIDGSIVSTMTEKNAAGAVIATGTMRQSADGRVTTLELDSDNNGHIDRSEMATTRIDGSVVSVVIDRNVDGSLKQTVTQTLSASGRLLNSLTTDNLARKTAETITAIDGSSTTTTYNAATGQALTVVQANSSGITTGATLYDPLNANPWSRVEQAFDAAGRLTGEKQYLDNGTRVDVTFDVASGKQSWVRYYNASNVLTATVEHDFSNVNAWLRIERSYDSAGRTTAHNQFNDNGTRVLTSYDASNAISWSSVVEVFNGAGQKSNEYQYYDNGNRTEIDFSGGRPASARYYSAGNALTGSTSYTHDLSNVKPWTSYNLNYDSAQRLISKVINYDDSTRVEVYFNARGTLTQQSEFNSSGAKIGDIFYTEQAYWVKTSSDDEYWRYGPVFSSANSYDPANLYSWSTIQWFWGEINHSSSYEGETDYMLNGLVDGNPRGSISFGPYTSFNLSGMYQYMPSSQKAQSPVLLDLDGNQDFELLPIGSKPADNTAPSFDWDGDGTRDATAWVRPADGFLAIDLATDGSAGGDGHIDQAKELAFSTWADPALEPDGVVTDLDGLRLVFDTNHDNVLDSNDARWNEFRVWQDANQNGITDAGELRTMSEAGIKLVNLVPSPTGSRSFADGSAITGTSSAQRVDGTSMLVADATLAYRSQHVGLN